MDKNQQIDEMVESRLHHRRPDDTTDKERMMLKIRNVLNIVFMILAVVGAVLVTGGGIIGTAVVVKTAEVAIRLFKV